MKRNSSNTIIIEADRDRVWAALTDTVFVPMMVAVIMQMGARRAIASEVTVP